MFISIDVISPRTMGGGRIQEYSPFFWRVLPEGMGMGEWQKGRTGKEVPLCELT